MKKMFFAMALLCGAWMGARIPSINSASAQVVTPLTGMANPLTNGMGFTNTLVQPTNLNELQLEDVADLLLNLQTNVEETLPAISLLTSNVTFAAPSPTPTSTSTQFHGVIQPMTSGPAPLVSVQTAPGANTLAPTQQTSISLTVGTNTFIIDPPTLQALVQLRDDLQRALPVLQALNGTTPTNGSPATFLNPPVTNLFAAPVTNNFFTPLTNPPPTFGQPVASFGR